MTNIFLEQPEFIDNDPRVNRPEVAGYNLTAELMLKKQSFLLPVKLLKNKRILDLGSSLAASGAWCLSNGASYYKGVEIQEDLSEKSRNFLSKYYDEKMWDIEKASIENFLLDNTEEFDIIIAAEIIHAFQDPVSILKMMTKIAQVIVIESAHPTTIRKTKYLEESRKLDLLKSEDYQKFIENEPFIEVGVQGMTVPGDKTLLFNSTKVSMGAVKHIMASEGFVYNDKMNKVLKSNMSDIFSPYKRYAGLFIKQAESGSGNYGFSSVSQGEAKHGTYYWGNDK